jgi:hypothetical protein
MTLLTSAIDVFAASASSERCIVAFLAKRHPGRLGVSALASGTRSSPSCGHCENEGWLLSVRAMFDPQRNAEPVAFDAGFAHDIDVAGAFEAPSISDALLGAVRLEQAGWLVASRPNGF